MARSTLFAAALAVAGVLVPRPALSQKVAVVVFSANAKQGLMAGKVANAVEEALAANRDVYHWREVFGPRSNTFPADAALKRKTKQVLGALKGNDASHAPIAELQQAMRAAAPVAQTTDIQIAQAAIGAIAWAGGDVPTAEQRLVEALSFDPSMQPLEVSEPPGFGQIWERARFEINDHSRGELAIASDPAGARVLVDGVPKGTSPVTVQGLTTGPHLVQLDLFGYELAGEIVRVRGGDGSYHPRLTATDLITESDLRTAVSAAVQNENGRFLADLCRKLDLEDVLAGWIAPRGNSLILGLAALRVAQGRVLASQEIDLERDDYGQAGARAASIANSLLEGKTSGAHGSAEKKSKPKDPLEGKDGTEDWQ